MHILIKIACAFFVLMACAGCKKESSQPTRSFYLGVTPWPADFTAGEVDAAYRFINSHCDMVSHHFDKVYLTKKHITIATGQPVYWLTYMQENQKPLPEKNYY